MKPGEGEIRETELTTIKMDSSPANDGRPLDHTAAEAQGMQRPRALPKENPPEPGKVFVTTPRGRERCLGWCLLIAMSAALTGAAIGGPEWARELIKYVFPVLAGYVMSHNVRGR
jgi:hypothetical protein